MAKGASYERAICKRLSMWVSNLHRQDCFWRSAMSGGRATVLGKFRAGGHRNTRPKHDAHAGDIVATHPLGNLLCQNFVVECKHYKDLKWTTLVYGGAGQVLGFWHKVKAEAFGSGRQPLLVMRQNSMPDIVMTTCLGYYDLCKMGRIPLLVRMHGKFGTAFVFKLQDLLVLNFNRYRKRHGEPMTRVRLR
jgi:hypothetical protein